MRRRAFCVLSRLIAVALIAANFASAQVVYNLTSDWSDVNNPNGAWRLKSSPTTTFATNWADYWNDGSNQRAWADDHFQNNAHVPVWMKLTTSSLSGFASIGTVVMHTAESGRTGTEFSSVTWTSPGAGAIAISGSTWLSKLTADGRPQTWELRLNGVSFTSGNLTPGDSYTQSAPFDFVNGSGGASVLNANVSANDVVELLFYRTSTSTPGTLVGVNFQVSFTAIPEPAATAVLAGVGALGLAALRGRFNCERAVATRTQSVRNASTGLRREARTAG